MSIGSDTHITNCIIDNYVTIAHSCYLRNVRLNTYTRIFRDSVLCDAELGKYSYVAGRCDIANAAIGRFCSIGRGVRMAAGNHPTQWLSTSPVFYSNRRQCGISLARENYFEELKGIKIENDVWIGNGACILDGVNVGNGAIIGSGAVVNGDVDPYAVVGGVPAKLIRQRFPADIVSSLLQIRWWDWEAKKLKDAHPFFVGDDIREFIDWAGKQNM